MSACGHLPTVRCPNCQPLTWPPTFGSGIQQPTITVTWPDTGAVAAYRTLHALCRVLGPTAPGDLPDGAAEEWGEALRLLAPWMPVSSGPSNRDAPDAKGSEHA